MKLLFAHGLESAPIGRKSQALIDAGYDVVAPNGRGRDLAQRIEGLLAVITASDDLPLVVGSSFGGIASLIAVIMAADQGVLVPGLVLCAPALHHPPPPGTAEALRCPVPTVVIHGIHDTVCAIELSRDLARDHGAQLREVDDDHGLGNAGLSVLLEVVAAMMAEPRESKSHEPD